MKLHWTTGEDIQDTELLWLRQQTGWTETISEEQRVIADARRCNPVARDLCALWFNTRYLNKLIENSRDARPLVWRACMRRAGWLEATTNAAPDALGLHIVGADSSLLYSVHGRILLVGPREVTASQAASPATPPKHPDR